MDCRRIIKDCRNDGIFGELYDINGGFICVTLEHAFLQEDGSYAPAIPSNSQFIVKLEFSEKFQRDLYELKDVPGHTEIKFHILNFNEESDGCIGLGKQKGRRGKDGWMICDSKKAFDAFMLMQKDVDSFTLFT